MSDRKSVIKTRAWVYNYNHPIINSTRAVKNRAEHGFTRVVGVVQVPIFILRTPGRYVPVHTPWLSCSHGEVDWRRRGRRSNRMREVEERRGAIFARMHLFMNERIKEGTTLCSQARWSPALSIRTRNASSLMRLWISRFFRGGRGEESCIRNSEPVWCVGEH